MTRCVHRPCGLPVRLERAHVNAHLLSCPGPREEPPAPTLPAGGSSGGPGSAPSAVERPGPPSG